MKLKIGFISDIHYTEAQPQNWRVPFGKTVLSNLQWIVENYGWELDLLILGGDVGHASIWTSEEITNFYNTIRPLEKNKSLRVITCVGNHDITNYDIETYYKSGLHIISSLFKTSFRRPTIVETDVYSREEFSFQDSPTNKTLYIDFYDAPAFKQKDIQKRIKNAPTTKYDSSRDIFIQVMHGPIALNETMYCKGVNYLKDSKADLILLADIHEQFDYKDPSKTKGSIKPQIINPGPLERRNISERDIKPSFTYIEVDMSKHSINAKNIIIPDTITSSEIFDLVSHKTKVEGKKNTRKNSEKLKSLKALNNIKDLNPLDTISKIGNKLKYSNDIIENVIGKFKNLQTGLK